MFGAKDTNQAKEQVLPLQCYWPQQEELPYQF